MRTPAYLAGLAVFGLTALFQAQPARAAIDCDHCQAVYTSCLQQGHDADYCMAHVAPACFRQCPLVSTDGQRDLLNLDTPMKDFAMNKGKTATSLLAAIQ